MHARCSRSPSQNPLPQRAEASEVPMGAVGASVPEGAVGASAEAAEMPAVSKISRLTAMRASVLPEMAAQASAGKLRPDRKKHRNRKNTNHIDFYLVA